jgi:hypothetical protein
MKGALVELSRIFAVVYPTQPHTFNLANPVFKPSLTPATDLMFFGIHGIL